MVKEKPLSLRKMLWLKINLQHIHSWQQKSKLEIRGHCFFFFPKKEKKSIWKMGCIGTCGMWVLQQKIQNENNNVEV
jgi:hypothetical protein